MVLPGARDKNAFDLDVTSPTAKASSVPGRSTLGGDSADGLVGTGLPYRQKSLFQASLGTDLSDVRVRTDADAARQADAHDARAFAVGNEIAFAEGQYRPDTPEGDRLLAHEVAHTVQQRTARGTGAPPLATTTPDDRAEQNADAAASAMVEGRPTTVTSEPVAIARKGNSEPVEVNTSPSPEGNAAPVVATPEGNAEGKTEGAGPVEAKAEGNPADVGELTAERVGQVPDEDDAPDQPVGAPPNTEAFKSELQDSAPEMPKEGAETPAADATAGEALGPSGDGGVEVSPALLESVEGAKADAKAGAAEAESESAAFKAEMNDRRDRFDNEQVAIAVENLRTMKPADKRAALIELGYDKKAVKKMKDGELDGVITGRLETEQRKTRILGMDEDELARLTPAQKSQFLIDLGIDAKDVNKIGPAKAAKAFDDIIRVAKVPGQHKVKVKVKGGLLGKSWEVTIKVDSEGQADFSVKKKGGFLSKLFGWIKALAPIVLTFVLPAAGLIALAVFQTVTSIIKGDWLGAIIGAAGAFVAVGALKSVSQGASGAAKAFSKIATVAGKVEKVARAAQASIAAAKAKSPGGLLAALAQGASAFASFASDKAASFKAAMERFAQKLDRYAKIISGGEKVVAGVKSGNFGTALGGAFDAVAASTSRPNAKGEETNATAARFQRLSRIAGYAAAGQTALKAENYSGVVDAALGIAGELEKSKRFQDGIKIASAANRLGNAVATKNPEAIASAALALAEAINVAKYDAENPDSLDETGKPKVDESGRPIDADRAKLLDNYRRAANVVRYAGTVIRAVSGERPNYLQALDAATGIIAELTENKKFDRAALLTARLDLWTAAIRSKNELAIVEAGKAFGDALAEIRGSLIEERDQARREAEAKLAPGEELGDDGGTIPPLEIGLTDTVNVPGTADFIELQPPGLVTELDLDNDGSTDFRTTAGPDPLPSQPTGGIGGTPAPVSARAPTTQRPRVFQGPPTTTRTPATPGSGRAPVQRLQLPQLSTDARDLFDAVKSGAKILDKQFGIASVDKFIETFESLQRTYARLSQEQNAPLEEIRDFSAALEAAVKLPNLWVAIESDVRRFESAFFNLDDDARPSLNVIRELGKRFKFAKRFSRIVKVPAGAIELYEKAAEVVGYKSDYSGDEVTVRERLAAAAYVAQNAALFRRDLQWAIRAADLVFAKFGRVSIEAAIEVVARAAGRYGTRARDLIVEGLRPTLQKLAERESAQFIATKAAQLAEEIGSWRFAFSGALGDDAVKGAFRGIASKFGIALRFGLSAPAAVAFEIAQLELLIAERLYREALGGFSAFLTPNLFGRNINDIRQEVQNFPDKDVASCDRFIYYAFYQIFTNAPQSTKRSWEGFFLEKLQTLILGGTFARELRSNPYEALRNLEPLEVKKLAVGSIKDFALEFLDREFRRAFVDRT